MSLCNYFLYVFISLKSFWGNFGPLLFTTFHHFFEICGPLLMHSSLKVMPPHFHQGEAWTLTGSARHLDSVIFQLFCCRFAGVQRSFFCCMAQFQQSFSCRTDGLTFDSRILWYIKKFMVHLMKWPVHFGQTSPLFAPV